MGKSEKLIKKILENRTVTYSEAEKVLFKLGYALEVCSSHHVFRKKGYLKNISIKKRKQLLPYQLRDLKEVLREHGY